MTKKTTQQRKKELYDKTTQARAEFHLLKNKLLHNVRVNQPGLSLIAQYEIIESNPDYIRAEERLYALCDACNILGMEGGN